MTWNDRAAEYKAMIEAGLKRYLPAPEPGDPAAVVKESMLYSLMCGGKRIRPTLTLAFCELCGGRPEDALPFACAVEMVHTYSLIHDDMPCMDDDDLRRGKPTNHKVYGEGVALIAGDGLLTKAFEAALSHENGPIAAKAALVLAQCAGDNGMVGGQCVDMQSGQKEITIETLQIMDEGKTVALIDAACRMGCIAAGADEQELEAAHRYAWGLGMAFQIRDDVLDVLGDAAALGKNVGMDNARDKQNYVSLLGVDKAQSLVREYTAQAVSALDSFPGDPVFLQELARAMEGREA